MNMPFLDPNAVYAFSGYNFAVCLLIVGVLGLLLSYSQDDYSVSKFMCWLLVAGSWMFAFISCIYRMQDIHMFQWNWNTGLLAMVYEPSVRLWFDYVIAVVLVPTFILGSLLFGEGLTEMASGMSHENSD